MPGNSNYCQKAIIQRPFKTVLLGILAITVVKLYTCSPSPLLEPEKNRSTTRKAMAQTGSDRFSLKLVNRIGSTRSNEQAHGHTTVPIIAVSCGPRSGELIQMLKSAMIFTQDAHLHATIIADEESVRMVAKELTELKRRSAHLKWDFTFNLRLKRYPGDTEDWFHSKRWLCSTLRLFFPSMFPDVDTFLYLDTDVIILSNLTETWLHFKELQQSDPLAVAVFAELLPKPARGLYSQTSQVPYYGHSGLNAGVIMMNLTRMREFDLERYSTKAYQLYKDRIEYLDQDIYNIIFNSYPNRVKTFDCTYDFHRGHCGDGKQQTCWFHSRRDGPVCFCHEVFNSGVKIVHGAARTFSPEWPFLYELKEGFSKIEIGHDDPVELIRNLKAAFHNLTEKPACFGLTADNMYSNAEQYLMRLK